MHTDPAPYATTHPVPAPAYVLTDASGRQVVVQAAHPVNLAPAPTLQHAAPAHYYPAAPYPAEQGGPFLTPGMKWVLVGGVAIGTAGLGLWGLSLAVAAIAAALAALVKALITLAAILGGGAVLLLLLRVNKGSGRAPAGVTIVQTVKGRRSSIKNRW